MMKFEEFFLWNENEHKKEKNSLKNVKKRKTISKIGKIFLHCPFYDTMVVL